MNQINWGDVANLITAIATAVLALIGLIELRDRPPRNRKPKRSL